MITTQLLLGLLITYTYALSCTQQHECQTVSENFGYVQCLNSVCKCRTDMGFTGDATTNSKCRCEENGTVVWPNADKPADQNIPMCRAPDSQFCTAQWMCAITGTSLTLDYNFVDCVQQKCVCRTDHGFSGDATPDSPCFCDAALNRTVLWDNGTAYCDDPISRAPVEDSQDPDVSKTCNEHWQCQEVTKYWGAVDCIANLCACRNDLGFEGNGNETDPCDCPAGKKVIWLENSPYCVVFPPPAPIEDEFETLDEAFLELTARFQGQIQPLITEVNAVFILAITSEGGTGRTWVLDLRTGKGTLLQIAATAEQTAAGLTITMSDEDLLLIFNDKIKPQELFADGRIALSGNMVLLPKLKHIDDRLGLHLFINLSSSK